MLKNLQTKKQALLVGVMGLVVIIISAGATYVYFRSRSISTHSGSPQPQTLTSQTEIDLDKTPFEDLNQLNVLLLGYGGAGHDGGYLTDVIQVVHVDFERSKVWMISVPRDLYVKLPTGKEAKINAAFTLGDDPNNRVDSGGVVAKEMVSQVTGLSMNYFIAVDFVSFERMIGQELDGIEVDVPETLDDPWYPIKGEELNTCGMSPEELEEVHQNYSGFELERQFECRFERLHFDQGPTVMEGGEALKFVRSRHGSGAGDFSRSQRQQAVLKAVRDKLISLGAFTKAPEFFESTSKHINSDIDLEVVKYLLPALKNASQFTTHSLVLSTDNVFTTGKSASGQFILLPKDGANNWQGVSNYINSQLTTE